MLRSGIFRCPNTYCASRKCFTSLRSFNAHMGQCDRARSTNTTRTLAREKINKNRASNNASKTSNDMLRDPTEEKADSFHTSNQDNLFSEFDDPAILPDASDDDLDVPGLPQHYQTNGEEFDNTSYTSFVDSLLPENALPGNSLTSELQQKLATGGFHVQLAERPRVSRVPTDLALLDLARLLDAARCPHYMFDKIISWCRYAGKVGCNPTADRLTSRDVYFSTLEKRLADIDVVIPQFKSKRVKLETASIKGDESILTSEINFWDFEDQLKSLLSDQSIFGDLNNLNVNPVNPFLPMRDYEQSGAWYQDTIQTKNITGHDGNFLIGIVIAADRTGNTWNQRFGTEPLLFTLSIIKESLWHYPKAWRILAMIPCDKDYKGQAAGNLHSNRKGGQGHSCRNYHTYLHVALESLRRVQSTTYKYWPYNENGNIPTNAKTMYRSARGTEDLKDICQGKPLLNNVPSHLMKGVRVNLVLGGNQKLMNVVCPVSHIILDGEGADKFTCRHVGKTKNSNRMSRGCDCTFEECGDPFVQCHPVSQAKIMEAYFQTKWSDTYIDQADGLFEEEMVDTCAVHSCENAWWKIDFGHQPNGLYSGPLPIDSLHAFEEGNNKRILTLILGEQNSSHGFCAKVDNVVERRLRKNVPKQGAAKNLPRMSYSRGISSLSHLAAHERVGVMCALTLVTISLTPKRKGHYILGRNPVPYASAAERQQVVLDRLVFCQLSLLFHCWVDNGPHKVLFVGKKECPSTIALRNRAELQKAISILGELQKMVFPREQGDGHHTQKFHDWYVHMLPSLIHAGNGRRIKADVSEKQHKYFCKAPGQTSQKHSQEIFLRGVCKRLRNTDILNHTRSLFELDEECDIVEIPSQPTLDEKVYKNTVHAPASIELTDSITTSKVKWNDGVKRAVSYHPFVETLIVHGCHQLKKLNLLTTGNVVPIFTELSIDGVVFRCHPRYRHLTGAWFDWALIKWSCKMRREWKIAKSLWKPSLESSSVHREVLLTLKDHLDTSDSYPNCINPKPNDDVDIFVPARILAFIEGKSNTNSELPDTMYAVVQSCESECYTDSLITRRWKKISGPPNKTCQVVEVAAIACPCYVIEAEPGFYDNHCDRSHDMIVHEVFDRKASWGKKFLEVVDRGITTVCYKHIKVQLDKNARKYTTRLNTKQPSVDTAGGMEESITPSGKTARGTQPVNSAFVTSSKKRRLR